MAGLLALEVPDNGAYQVVLVAHLVAVVVGFGGLVLTRRLASGSALEGRVEWFVYAVPVLGVVLVMLSEDRWHFSESWLGWSFLAYLAAVGLHHGILRRARRAAPSGTEPDSTASRRHVAAGALFDVLVVTAIALMVTKPGS